MRRALFFSTLLLGLSSLGAWLVWSDLTITTPSFTHTAPRTSQETTTPLRRPPAPLGKLSEAGIIAESNRERRKLSLQPLRQNSQLHTAAQNKAEDILARQYFEHVAPDGTDVADLVLATGYTYLRVGENLALGGFTSDADVVEQWMNSPGHRANILNDGFREIGVGVARGTYEGSEVLVVVQTFASPASICPAVDTALATDIEARRTSVDTLATQLTELTAQLNAIATQTSQRDDYDSLAQRYDQLRDKYEQSSLELRTLIDTYNGQVARYNNCLSNN